MKKNVANNIKAFLFKKIIFFSIIQTLCFLLILLFIGFYVRTKQIVGIEKDLLINDEYTLQEIASADILGNSYALSLELHNIGDMRKLDFIRFEKNYDKFFKIKNCKSVSFSSKICSGEENEYYGINSVFFGKELMGYIITSKKYDYVFYENLLYYFSIVLTIIFIVLIFNILFFVRSVKSKIEKNTVYLMKFIEEEFNLIHLNEIEFAEFKEIAKKFIDTNLKIKNFEKQKTIFEIGKTMAVEIAHDIRSPLASLNTCLKNLSMIQDKDRILMRTAINRINDIANNMLSRYKNERTAECKEGNSDKTWLMSSLLESLVSEKKIQYSDSKIVMNSVISDMGFSVFSKFDDLEMKRLLSNLIDNSFEACRKENGKIRISLDADKDNIILKISDNGVGIPKDKMDKVIQGITLKSQGHGLGLSRTKKYIDSLGGKFQIKSKENFGTVVQLRLQRSLQPEWFLSEIICQRNSSIVFLDDDESIHCAWKERFLDLENDIDIQYFLTSSSLKTWCAKKQNSAVQIFSDYELIDDKENGIDILESFGKLNNFSLFLVTSYYENQEIINRCIGSGIKILPKNLIPYIPLRLEKNIDLVLIDNDKDIIKLWERCALLAKKNMVSFSDPISFEKELSKKLSLKTPIYIDSNLGSDFHSGEFYANKFFNLGFNEIYLTTGYRVSDFRKMPWIKGIIDKSPPF